jgi:subtilisin-like proprotein convertase family protein
VSNPGGGALTGTWSTDGRAINPDSVLDISLRSTSLASFNGLDPNGAWTLFVADVSPVGTGRLVSWQLEVTGSSVPEPGSALAGVMTIGAALSRRRR